MSRHIPRKEPAAPLQVHTQGVAGVRVYDTNWMQIADYLERDDRIVLPVGSTEQHGYLSLGTDAILAERVAVEAAEPLGVPVLPALPFGLAPYFAAYPGSMTLRVSTYVDVVRDLLDDEEPAVRRQAARSLTQLARRLDLDVDLD